MKYQEHSFTLPASNPTKTGKNIHGQTWEDIFETSPSPEFLALIEALKNPHNFSCSCVLCVADRQCVQYLADTNAAR